MARGVIPVSGSGTAGTVLGAATPGDAVNGHVVANSGSTTLLVKNTGASSRTVSFIIRQTVDGQVPAVKSRVIAAGAEYAFSDFDTSIYGSQLQVDVTHAELTLRAFE